MNVPFPALKKAFILHTMISTLAIISFMGLHVFLSSLFGGFFALPVFKREFALVSNYHVICILSLVFIFLIYSMYWSKDSKYIFYRKPKGFFRNLISFFIFSIVGFIYLGLNEYFNFSEALGFFVPFGALFVGITLFQNKAIFHQCNPMARRIDILKFLGMGYAICFSIYMLSSQFAKSDLLDSSLKPQQRAVAFEFMEGLSPKIDEETFFAIHPHVDTMSKKVLYSRLDFPASHIGVAFFMKDGEKGFWPLWEMVLYGNLDKEFLVELYDHMEQNPTFWNKSTYTYQLKYLSYLKWPKNEKLPERFLAAKLSSKKNYVASKVKAREVRLNRKAASENP